MNPQPNEKYKHFKGNEYEIVALAKHSETLEDIVVYKALYGEGQIWVRPLAMFLDMKVQEDGTQVQRFTKIG
jgi:cyclomaltodextrinase / maltogenic alpha-amylase / neopullulanase